MKITDDASFDKCCDWLTKRAKIIFYGDLENRNPLVPKEQREAWEIERAERMRKYDQVAAEVLKYNESCRPQQHQTQKKNVALDAFLD